MSLNITKRSFFYSILFSIGMIFSSYLFSNAETYKCDTPEEKVHCTALLNQTEDEINRLADQLSATKQTGASLERDKQILAIQVKQAQLQIKAHELSIANIGKDIVQKTKVIQTLNNKIDDGKETLGQILRKTNQLDDYSLPEVVLGSKSISSVFADLDAFDSVKVSLSSVFTELRDSKKANEEAKVSLDQKRNQEIDTKVSIEADKKKVQAAEAEKQRLLNLNKNEQAGYQKIITDKKAQAAQIKAALFKLAGGGAAIPFGTALQFAKSASAVSGVDPAFVLAILTQESNLGANVGKCYLTDTTTGAGVSSKGTKFPNVMKPSRDVPPFLDITSRLGIDPMKTMVSCPIPSAGGWGGAMGPAQFIASTWQLVDKRVASALGVSATNPWDPEHAIMASAIFLADRGAVAGSYTSELKAACRYYGTGGATCTYGRSVQTFKAKIQKDIDVLNNQ